MNGKLGEVVCDPLRGGASRPTARVTVRLKEDGRELALKGVNVRVRGGRRSSTSSEKKKNEKKMEEGEEECVPGTLRGNILEEEEEEEEST